MDPILGEPKPNLAPEDLELIVHILNLSDNSTETIILDLHFVATAPELAFSPDNRYLSFSRDPLSIFGSWGNSLGVVEIESGQAQYDIVPRIELSPFWTVYRWLPGSQHIAYFGRSNQAVCILSVIELGEPTCLSLTSVGEFDMNPVFVG